MNDNDDAFDAMIETLVSEGLMRKLPGDRLQLTDAGKASVAELLENNAEAASFFANLMDETIKDRGGNT